MKINPFRTGAAHTGLVAAMAVLGLLLAACGSSSGAETGGKPPKTIVFSVPSLKVAAMKQMATGVEAFVKPEGWKVVAQDGNMDGQQQAQQLSTVVASGTAGAVWIIAISPSSLSQVLRDAQKKGIPVVTNGAPADYGFDGLQPGITFDTIDYAKYGENVGTALGTCITEKLGGEAEVVWGQPVVGASGKEEMEKAELSALKAAAPNAKIVSEIASSTVQAAQTDVGSALQGHPDANAVLASVDEVALGAITAFASAGKDLPCAVSAGGGPEAQTAVKDGKMYATVALQFQDDVTQSFHALEDMWSDPTKTGEQLYVPQQVVTTDK
jgi:ABC-type sugar transport system substrate-binding protein